MTLATTPRYDPDRTVETGENAVVVGAGMAGLLTARVLADGFREVTVIDRDTFPAEPVTRRGVPQGGHVHLLLEAGRATLEDLFPGYGEDLITAGGLVIDGSRDVMQYEEGDFLADGLERSPIYFATRPLFEQVVRRRVAELYGVTLRSGCQWTDYVVNEEGTTVEGVEVQPEGGSSEELAADLVVDATGRTSRTPTWLERHGYRRPAVDEVYVDIAYSTARIERPVDDRRMIFVAPSPPRARGGAAFPVEDGRRLVTLFGLHGDHPPTDTDGLTEFASSLPVPHFERLLDTQPWVTEEIERYPFPANIRRRYEQLDRFPDGLLVIGDALASFNPIYGQGMSVAALEALVLHHTLASGSREDLALRFFARTEGIIDTAWTLAVGGDFAFPQTEGPKPRGTDLINGYLSRLLRSAHTDGVLRDAFGRVLMMERPPTTLFHPRIVWRVLKPTT